MHTWKRGTAKVRTENSLCNREVQISHLPRAQVTPRTEAALLFWAKNLCLLLFFWSLKGGDKGQKLIISVWNWVCLGNAGNSESQLCVPKRAAMRWHLQAHTGLSTLSQHLVDVYPFVPIWSCCFVGSAPTLGPCWRQFQGQIREYWGGYRRSLHSPVLFTAPAHTWEPRTDVLDPTRTFLCSHYQETPPSPPPQNKLTGIEGIITLQNEPELHWRAECVPC